MKIRSLNGKSLATEKNGTCIIKENKNGIKEMLKL